MLIKQKIFTSPGSIIEEGQGGLQYLRSLGIQGAPGTKFKFYVEGEPSDQEIIMGPSGIYQISFSQVYGNKISNLEIIQIVGNLPVIVDYFIMENPVSTSEEEG